MKTESSEIKTVSESLKNSGDSCFVLKCGGGFIFYVAMRNGELFRTRKIGEAAAFESINHAENFASIARCDTRNAKTFGKDIGTSPITKS